MAQRDWFCLWSTGMQVQPPSPAHWVKDPSLQLLLGFVSCRLQLLLGFDPWPGNSICCRAAKIFLKVCVGTLGPYQANWHAVLQHTK